MRDKLEKALYDTCQGLMLSGVTFIKYYEIEFQKVIEEMFPDKAWWEVTDCQIFMHLLEYKDPMATVDAIVEGLKEE